MARIKYSFHVEAADEAENVIVDKTPIDSPVELPLAGDVMVLDPGQFEVKRRLFVYNAKRTKCRVAIGVDPTDG